MGIPGLIIEEEMVSNIQNILESAGIKVVKEKNSYDKGKTKIPNIQNKEPYLLDIPNFCFRCENAEGYRVKLDFGRLVDKPYPLTIAIRPEPHSSFFKSIIKPDKNKLVDEIFVILMKNGAREFNKD